MPSRIHAIDIARELAAAGHTNSEKGHTWTPGFRVSQASPRTVRIHHDGPDEHTHLDQYATALRNLGYTVTSERPRGRRPSIRATHA
ncbi:hypothetical protein ACIQKB_04040 [Streptomyces sp. NPDC092046]|uniref:hypothetical protein n=1 Tax=Streptomyces sp. NPDC092046 TaxID=3366009 RepID=UPI003804B490